MAAAVANTGLAHVTPATATPAIEVIVIDDNSPDGDAVASQECKVEPNDVLETDAANPAQADGDVADDDFGNTHEGVNPTQPEDNPEQLGLAVNPEGQRRYHRIAREYHDGQIHLSYGGNPYICFTREVCFSMTRDMGLERVRTGWHYLPPPRSSLVLMWTE